VVGRKLVVNEAEAKVVHNIFARYVELGSVPALTNELDFHGVRSKSRTSRTGKPYGSARFTRGALYALLKNVQYVGQVSTKANSTKASTTPLLIANCSTLRSVVWKRAGSSDDWMMDRRIQACSPATLGRV
jgi:hypothetical protein